MNSWRSGIGYEYVRGGCWCKHETLNLDSSPGFILRLGLELKVELGMELDVGLNLNMVIESHP
jgi:hypothetical protein